MQECCQNFSNTLGSANFDWRQEILKHSNSGILRLETVVYLAIDEKMKFIGRRILPFYHRPLNYSTSLNGFPKKKIISNELFESSPIC